MSDDSVKDTLWVTTCDTHASLAAASGLFNEYRHHYGEPPGADERTLGWLTDMVRSNMLTVYTAFVGLPADAPPIGLATAHVIPASLAMGRFWQLRDLYVLPGFRRRGAAAALVSAVSEAALGAGATRLSLTTEPGNRPRSASTGDSDSGLSMVWCRSAWPWILERTGSRRDRPEVSRTCRFA